MMPIYIVMWSYEGSDYYLPCSCEPFLSEDRAWDYINSRKQSDLKFRVAEFVERAR